MDDKFDLGIDGMIVSNNAKEFEDFFSDAPAVTTSADEVEKIKTPAEGGKKADEGKVVDKDEIDIIEEFLGSDLEEEDEDEDLEEEEKPEAKPKTKTPDAEEDEDLEEGLNQFEVLSKELYKANVFTAEEGEDPIIAKTPEEFLTLFQEEKRKGGMDWVENFLGNFGDDRKELFQAIYVDGVDPKDYLPVYNHIQDFANIDLSVETNQEKVVREYYSRLNWSEDKIESKIKKLKDYSDLEDEALTIHPQIIEQDKRSLEDIQTKSQEKLKFQAQQDEEYKNSLAKILDEKSKQKQLDGLPLNEATKKQVFDYLYVKRWKTPDGQLLTDFDKFILETKKSENLEQRVKIALLKLNNFDFSKIEKKAVSKESNTLFAELAQKRVKKRIAPKTTNW